MYDLSRLINLGNTTYAGAASAVTANIVLIGYIIAAFIEDDSNTKKHD